MSVDRPFTWHLRLAKLIQEPRFSVLKTLLETTEQTGESLQDKLLRNIIDASTLGAFLEKLPFLGRFICASQTGWWIEWFKVSFVQLDLIDVTTLFHPCDWIIGAPTYWHVQVPGFISYVFLRLLGCWGFLQGFLELRTWLPSVCSPNSRPEISWDAEMLSLWWIEWLKEWHECTVDLDWIRLIYFYFYFFIYGMWALLHVDGAPFLVCAGWKSCDDVPQECWFLLAWVDETGCRSSAVHHCIG